MALAELTRAEAEERARLITVREYAIELDLTRGPAVFGSTTVLRFDATEGASTFVDVVADVHAIALNGLDLDPAAVFDGSRIRLAGLAGSNELVVRADARYTNSGEGLHRFVDPADGEAYLYTQMAVPDARRVFAVFDQPDLKAPFRLTVTAPSRWQVVGNSPTPEPEPLGSDAARWSFAATKPLPSYLVALIAGPYAVRRGELTSADGRTIALGAFARASLEPHLDAAAMFDAARAGFALYERLFGIPYPFDKYDQLFVPEYNWGAMENAGAVTFNEEFVFRSKVTDAARETRVMVVLHELAHMWFGDLVTMRWWDDLWLNESFATFISHLATAEATEWTDAWATFNAGEKNRGYRQDQLPSTHPIVADIPDVPSVQVNFDGITYAKGASVLRQLAAYVGRDAFITGVGAYLERHAWGNATLADLLAALGAASGRDLAAWSRAWLQTAGVNTVTPEIETDADGVLTAVRIRQTAAAEQPVLRPHRLAVGLYEPVGEDGALQRVQRIELDVDGEVTEVPGLTGFRRPALLLVNDDDLAYAKIRLDPVSLATATTHLSRIEDALARSLVWSSMWDATRDGELAASAFVRLVQDHLGAETSSPVLTAVLQHVVLAAEEYVDPAERDAVLTGLAARLRDLAAAAAPGSDAQLQCVTAFGRTARTPEQLDLVQHLLDGSAPLPGLVIDTDLRWRLLTGLVVGGRAGEAEIGAALADDGTAAGHEAAAEARAAIPTAAGKAAAWASVVDDASMPNEQVRRTAIGFRRVADPEVLEPYVEQYFARVEGFWATRSFSIAEGLTRGLYPAPLARARLVDATRDWLDAQSEPTPVRRLVVEALAGVERARTAQERDRRG